MSSDNIYEQQQKLKQKIEVRRYHSKHTVWLPSSVSSSAKTTQQWSSETGTKSIKSRNQQITTLTKIPLMRTSSSSRNFFTRNKRTFGCFSAASSGFLSPQNSAWNPSSMLSPYAVIEQLESLLIVGEQLDFFFPQEWKWNYSSAQ